MVPLVAFNFTFFTVTYALFLFYPPVGMGVAPAMGFGAIAGGIVGGIVYVMAGRRK